jgi:hypothetical protein
MRIPLPVGLAAAAALVGASLAPAAANVLHPGPAFQRNIIPQTLTRAQVQQLHPNVLQKQVYQNDLRWMQTHHPVLPDKKGKGKAPTEWLMDDSGYIWGIKGKKVVTYLSDCSGAEGGVVDHSGRLVVACTNTSTVNIYNAGNTTGPADVVLNDTPGFYPAAAFEDTAGNVYATNLYGFACTTYSCQFYDGNIVRWNVGFANGAAPSASITDSNMYEVYFGDVDANGNCYIDGFNTASFVPQVDEVSGCNTASGTVTGTNLGIALEFPGGVYVVSPTSGSPLLSVIDQGYYGSGQDALYLYNLGSYTSPIAIAYPPQNIQDLCDPVAGGYDKAENAIKIGDAGCHAADVGDPYTNKWKNILNINFDIPIDGAFIPSDK